MSPITVETPEGGEPTLVVPDKPDTTTDGKRIWTLDQDAIEQLPDAVSRLTMAGFTYVGAEFKKDKTILSYTREDPDAVQEPGDAVQEEKADSSVDPTEGVPPEDADAEDESDDVSDSGKGVSGVSKAPRAKKDA